jgi:chaperonin GroEL (HSP60 family)
MIDLNFDEVEASFGFVDKVTFFSNNTTLFEKGRGFKQNTERYTHRMTELRQEADRYSESQRISRNKIRARLNKLEGINATILVGGRTHDEKSSLKYLIDDSVLACKSVIRNGYTMGANYAIYYAITIINKVINSIYYFSWIYIIFINYTL